MVKAVGKFANKCLVQEVAITVDQDGSDIEIDLNDEDLLNLLEENEP